MQAAAHPGARGCHIIQPSPQLPQLWWGCSLGFLLTHSPGPLPTLRPSDLESSRLGGRKRGRTGQFRGWDADPGRGRCLHSCKQPPYPQPVNGHITPSCPPATAPETVGPNERKAGRAAVCIIHMHGEVYIYPHVPPHPTAAANPDARRVSGHERSGCSGPWASSPASPPSPAHAHSLHLTHFGGRSLCVCLRERESKSVHTSFPQLVLLISSEVS